MDEYGHLSGLPPLDRAFALVAREFAAARARGDEECAGCLLRACREIDRAAKWETGTTPRKRPLRKHARDVLYQSLCKSLRARAGLWVTRQRLSEIMAELGWAAGSIRSDCTIVRYVQRLQEAGIVVEVEQEPWPLKRTGRPPKSPTMITRIRIAP